MTKNPDLARFVAQLLPNAIKNGGAGMHRALLVFHAGALLDFIATSKELNEGTTTLLLAASLDVLQAEPGEVQKTNTSLLQEAVVRTHLPCSRRHALIHFFAACELARFGRPIAEVSSHQQGYESDPCSYRGVRRKSFDEAARTHVSVSLWAPG